MRISIDHVLGEADASGNPVRGAPTTGGALPVVATHRTDPNLQQFFRLYGASSGLFYMGHASVLCVFGGKRILFDPVVLSKPYGDSWAFYPPQVIDTEVFEVDAVVVSHIHQDHYDKEYLRAINSRVKVVVIGGRPSFESDLRANHISNLQIVEPETITEIFTGIYIYGVRHEYNGIDASVIAFNDDFCIYHGNDNYLQPDSLEKFRRVGPDIDVACIPYAYIHWYPFLLDYGDIDASVKVSECERLVNLYMEDCLSAIRILQPKLMIPFGANLLLNDGDAYSTMNMAVKTPIEFCEYAALRAPDLAGIVQPMLAGDFCGAAPGSLPLSINGNFDGNRYRAQADIFLKEIPEQKVRGDWRPIDREAFIRSLNDKVGQLTDHLLNTIRIECDYLGETLRVEVDCAEFRATWVEKFNDDLPYHHFTLDPIASGLWLNGLRFEEIIGTRRFTVRRVPNIYSKEVLRVVNTII